MNISAQNARAKNVQKTHNDAQTKYSAYNDLKTSTTIKFYQLSMQLVHGQLAAISNTATYLKEASKSSTGYILTRKNFIPIISPTITRELFSIFFASSNSAMNLHRTCWNLQRKTVKQILATFKICRHWKLKIFIAT